MSVGTVVGVDIGGTNIRIGASEDGIELTHFLRTSSKEVLTGRESLNNLTALLTEYIRTELDGTIPSAICLGLPATIDKARNMVIQAPNIKGFDGIPLRELLTAELGTTVFIEKDVNLLYCHDRNILHLDREGIHVGIYIGTGIGNAIFINGQPLTGKDGAAGELGHIPFVKNGKKCGCGNIGCSECYAAGKYLAELVETRFSGEFVGDLFIRYADSPELREFVTDVARVIAAEINILNPETVVLGGGVLNMKGFPTDRMLAEVKQFSRKPYPADSLAVYLSSDDVANGVKGAVAYALERLTGQVM